MQHMPDKEFDQLFRDKFNEAEIEPSTNLWANIETQLAPKRKRVFPIYWMAAASIAIAITAMLLLQKKEVIQLRGEVTAATDVPTATDSKSILADHTPSISISESSATSKSTRSFVSAESKKVKVYQANLPEEKYINTGLQPDAQTDRLAIKTMDVKPLDVLPVKETATENPIVIASIPTNTNSNTITETEDVTERKGIRNVGDIVNYVVDKVDKRDKKLVKFNTDDDDNSSIVGINIGFLKFNKKNR